MPATIQCQPCCTTPQSVDIPGIEGAPGVDGANGLDAYTTVTADFIVPAPSANATVAVVNALWMQVGQVVTFSGPANFLVISVDSATQATLKYLDYTGDVGAGATVTTGTGVGPGGLIGPTGPAGPGTTVLSATDTLDFGMTGAQSSSDLTIALTGAVDGDLVILGVPNAAVNNDSCYSAWVSAADTVTVRFNNYSGIGIDPASGDFTVAVVHP